jgi:uncharacterized protein (TIGR03067 family)
MNVMTTSGGSRVWLRFPRAAVCALLGACAFAAVPGVAADDAKQQAIAKDRQQIAGTWRIVALEVNGNPANPDDARKLTVINGPDGTWRLLSSGKEIAKGTNQFDPTQKPKTIDFQATEGAGQGQVYQGIYELGENTRRLCFSPPGKPRPKEFASPAGSEHILVRLEREKP